MKVVEGQLGSVQDELSKIRQMLSKLVEKGTEGSPTDPLTKGDILDAVMVEPIPIPSAQGEDDRGVQGGSVQVEGDQGNGDQEGSGEKNEGENEDGGEGEGSG